MDLKSIFTDEDAVSPVIGVILMVAITVILAAVIGTFVLGLGDQVQSTSPQASFNFDFTDSNQELDIDDTDGDGDATTGTEEVGDDSLSIVHDGGDSIDEARLSLGVRGAQGHTDTDGTIEDVTISADADRSTDAVWSGTVNAGSSIAINSDDFELSGTESNSLTLDGATVRVVWSSETGENSATLGNWEGPEA